ncbi:hypothetical protein LOZ58_004184 [Ophidiomyces ophidiicola]|nr:hypothetical protein LOZ58_004184 [Ophidiomyces ophidiicola]
MSFAIVLEAITLITYIVILAGGKQMRETGWKVLTVFLVFISLVQCGGMALVSYLFDNDERFYPGWKLDSSWIMFRGVCVITITVGESEAQFQAHKDLLCQKSPFFNGALMRDFKEAGENAISLPEDDPDTFERFLQWLYSGIYELSGLKTDEEVDERYFQLAQLYTLADKLEVPRLKHDIINELFMMKTDPDKPPQVDVIAYIYENTRERSPLRKLMVAWLVWHIDFQWYTTPSATTFLSHCPEFAADLAVALARRWVDFKGLSPFNESPEKFYEESAIFSPMQSPVVDNFKSVRLVTQKQPLVSANSINSSVTAPAHSRVRPLGVPTFGPVFGAPSSSRCSEPLRSPGLFSNADSDTTQTPTMFGFGSPLGSTSNTGL